MDPADRLRALNTEITEALTELRILDEQLAFLAETADDARIRALVAETPLADREARVATEDVERARRSREAVARRVEDLRREQDRILERMLERGAPDTGRRD